VEVDNRNTMCNSPGNIYAWIGSILVHLSFITIILWSASSDQGSDALWKVGLVCSALYTVLLFGLAFWLESHCEQQGHDEPAPEEESSPPRVKIISVKLLYGAAVLSLGVPGSFLVLRAIECCQSDSQIRHRNEGMLLVVSLPITVVSILLWKKKTLSSMVATALVGISLMLHNACMALDPGMDSFAVSLFVIGAVLVIFLTRAKVVRAENQDGKALQHCLALAAVLYFAGACGIFLTLGDDDVKAHRRLWRILGSTTLCFIPLAILGAGVQCMPMSLLGAFGLFLDALELADWLALQCSSTFSVPIHAAILAVAGLGIGALGLVLDGFQEQTQSWIESCFSCSDAGVEINDDHEIPGQESDSPETPLL